YVEYCEEKGLIYENTRKCVLGEYKPYYYAGEKDSGGGGQDTLEDYIWHIALALEGMTAKWAEEKNDILEIVKTSDADTNVIDEGFDVDDPNQFTRSWFSWANSMFSEFILTECGMYVEGSPLKK